VLDALSTDNKEQPLEWPVSEDLIGRNVRFYGYITGEYGFWGFHDDELYVIGRDADGVVGPLRHDGRSVGENYHNDLKFTLLPKESEEWPEGRQDVVGQNGNDGEHYEKPETTHDVSHHKRKDGTDLIDEWWNKYEPEVARVLMWEMVNKYNNRLGKKDPVHIEVAKMADYMARWSEKEFWLIK